MQEGPSSLPPTVTLADRVHRAAVTRADQPALLYRDQSLSWAELDAAVDTVAAALRARAPRSSVDAAPPRVAIALPNSPDFVVAFFATLRAGLVAVPVNPGATGPELRHILANSGASVLLGTERVTGLVAELTEALPALTTVHPGLPDPVEGAPPAAPASPSAGDLAVLLYTSGTEGQPKGAMLSHGALLANHEQIGRIEPPVVGPQDRVLLALPLFHAYGLNTGLGAVAYHGACGVLMERFDADATLDLIARHRVSVLVGVPSMFLDWAGRMPGDGAGPGPAGGMDPVRVAVCGAAPLDPAVAARFAAETGRPVLVGYGLTETAPVLTSTLVSPEPKSGSIGRPIPGVEVRLVAANGEVIWLDGVTGPEEPEEPDEPVLHFSSPGTDPGQIVVRGANLFDGYWPDRRGGPDPSGWWATGDIAYADADGDLFLVDRLGELILVNGFNVYPREVELALQAHPGVAESAVLGVPHSYTGQTVKAYVVPAAPDAVTAEELLRHCERQLARFKCPTQLEFVDTLPHSLIGKVRKTELRSEHRDHD